MTLAHLGCDFDWNNPALAQTHLHRVRFNRHLSPDKRIWIAGTTV
jgi:hypothetical protein